jgi:hypothetical protein
MNNLARRLDDFFFFVRFHAGKIIDRSSIVKLFCIILPNKTLRYQVKKPNISKPLIYSIK